MDRYLDRVHELGERALGYVIAFGLGFVGCMIAFGL